MRTPNFDRLDGNGIRFENAYCQVPTCGASRASLFTSIYPTVKRFPNVYTWAENDAAGVKTLPQRFKEAGYTTNSNGKVFHHVDDTNDRSWSEPAWRPETTGRTYYNAASKNWKAERLAGIEIKETIHGRSFAKLLAVPTVSHREEAYTRFESGDAITTEQFYYVRWTGVSNEGELLIDRKRDPQHQFNVAKQSKYESAIVDLRERLQSRVAVAESFTPPAQ